LSCEFVFHLYEVQIKYYNFSNKKKGGEGLQYVIYWKGKFIPVLNEAPWTPWRRMAEWRYRSGISYPRHWMEKNGQLPTPVALPPRKERPVPKGGFHSRSGRCGEEKISCLAGNQNSRLSAIN